MDILKNKKKYAVIAALCFAVVTLLDMIIFYDRHPLIDIYTLINLFFALSMCIFLFIGKISRMFFIIPGTALLINIISFFFLYIYWYNTDRLIQSFIDSRLVFFAIEINVVAVLTFISFDICMPSSVFKKNIADKAYASIVIMSIVIFPFSFHRDGDIVGYVIHFSFPIILAMMIFCYRGFFNNSLNARMILFLPALMKMMAMIIQLVDRFLTFYDLLFNIITIMAYVFTGLWLRDTTDEKLSLKSKTKKTFEIELEDANLLIEYKELLDTGVITIEEFTEKKNELLE